MLPGHLSAALEPTAVCTGSDTGLKALVPFSRCVLPSSEDMECGPLFKGVRTVSVMHQGLGVCYCCLKQMLFMKEFVSFLKGKQSHSCYILCSLCVVSQFYIIGSPFLLCS